MHEATVLIRTSASCAAVALLLLLGACATTDVEPEPVVAAADPIVELEPPTPARRHVPKPARKPPAVLTAPSISVVLTSRSAAYEDIAVELRRHFGDFAIYDLSDKSQPPVTAFRVVNDTDSTAVVAIGLRAAKSAVAMSTAPVVFSQVFNFREHALLTERSRGISAIPPLDMQLAEWKRIAPALSRVGLIVGEGHEDLVTEAELAAQNHGVELEIRTTHSDQETLYVFRRLVRNIDGFWLIPDNRVLSNRVLSEVLNESRRHNVLVAVPNDAMLPMGGAISMSTVASDIAARIFEVVRDIQQRGIASVAAITPLSEVRTLTNDAMLNQKVVAESAQ